MSKKLISLLENSEPFTCITSLSEPVELTVSKSFLTVKTKDDKGFQAIVGKGLLGKKVTWKDLESFKEYKTFEEMGLPDKYIVLLEEISNLESLDEITVRCGSYRELGEKIGFPEDETNDVFYLSTALEEGKRVSWRLPDKTSAYSAWKVAERFSFKVVNEVDGELSSEEQFLSCTGTTLEDALSDARPLSEQSV